MNFIAPEFKQRARNGKCIEFAYLLSQLYQGEIYWDEDHAIFKHQNKFYDITGEVACVTHLPLHSYGEERVGYLCRNLETFVTLLDL